MTLRVTPQISEGDSLRLEIFQEITDDQRGPHRRDGQTPRRSASRSRTARSRTWSWWRDDETVVIGGLISDKPAGHRDEGAVARRHPDPRLAVQDRPATRRAQDEPAGVPDAAHRAHARTISRARRSASARSSGTTPEAGARALRREQRGGGARAIEARPRGRHRAGGLRRCESRARRGSQAHRKRYPVERDAGDRGSGVDASASERRAATAEAAASAAQPALRGRRRRAAAIADERRRAAHRADRRRPRRHARLAPIGDGVCSTRSTSGPSPTLERGRTRSAEAVRESLRPRARDRRDVGGEAETSERRELERAPRARRARATSARSCCARRALTRRAARGRARRRSETRAGGSATCSWRSAFLNEDEAARRPRPRSSACRCARRSTTSDVDAEPDRAAADRASPRTTAVLPLARDRGRHRARRGHRPARHRRRSTTCACSSTAPRSRPSWPAAAHDPRRDQRGLRPRPRLDRRARRGRGRATSSALASEISQEPQDLLESREDDAPIIRLVNSLLQQAVKERASDIHIEPFENEHPRALPDRRRALRADHAAAEGAAGRASSRASRSWPASTSPRSACPRTAASGSRSPAATTTCALSTVPVALRRARRDAPPAAHPELLDLERARLRRAAARRLMSKLITRPNGIVLVTARPAAARPRRSTARSRASTAPTRTSSRSRTRSRSSSPGVGQIEVNAKIGLTFAQRRCARSCARTRT